MFLRNCQTFPSRLHHFAFLSAEDRRPVFPTSSSRLGVFRVYSKVITALIGVKWYLIVGSVCILLLSRRSPLYFWVLIPYQVYDLQVFCPFLWVIIVPLCPCVHIHFLNFGEVQHIYFIPCFLFFQCPIQDLVPVHHVQCWEDVPFSLIRRGCIVLDLTLKTMIHFE